MQSIDDQRKGDESEEQDIQFVEAREDPTEALEPPEPSLEPRCAVDTVSGPIPKGRCDGSWAVPRAENRDEKPVFGFPRLRRHDP